MWIFTADSENAYLFSVNFHGGYNLRKQSGVAAVI